MATVAPDHMSPDGFLDLSQSGYELLTDPLLNKGTAFTEAERDAFGLHGLLPPLVATLSDQIERRMAALRTLGSDLERYIFLRELQDNNETLFYAVVTSHLEELLPIIYTPTVGLGCEQFSRLYRRPRGLYLSMPVAERMTEILAQPRFERIETIVVTDGERILGLGDQGAGGMGIPIGKLALYTACGGLHPATTLPVFLDVGTDNEERRADPLYIGWHHERVRGEAYDRFIETFIEAVRARWPKVLLQWEDFARSNAGRLLGRYRDKLCTFNDDLQGTAGVATGVLLAALRVTGLPLNAQRICIAGAGTAGCGIASLMLAAMIDAGIPEREARARLFLVDQDGLLVEGMEVQSFQAPYVRSRNDVARWRIGYPQARMPWAKRYRPGRTISLLDTIHNARPTALIGVTGYPGLFSEDVVRAMAAGTPRPVILPLSNPTSRSEAAPADLLNWTDGKAIVGVGSPFPPFARGGQRVKVDQANNSYIFPGLGLGVAASGARRISDGMILASAKALAGLSPGASGSDPNLLPPVNALRRVAVEIALAVATQAQAEDLAPPSSRSELEDKIRRKMWSPAYLPYRRVSE